MPQEKGKRQQYFNLFYIGAIIEKNMPYTSYIIEMFPPFTDEEMETQRGQLSDAR